ncbi:integral membrane sensor signal transduction histidine kinase [Alkaliphilus metalliredigens QYMF]|uniref:histidine kinase n=1 Tax=Alkaliphilus metalliredigens (strain QYMF) TaxID=293826 RepID=A6TMR5_ALKMQ|nr:HAMP domain-containing sensor histidine kinase [Alkaliphilus metalliredigens]ABR47483.1 integral membrane sensor signal transduction histidine kinase [Alkaliphilus metalliredigens QYMF]
MYNLEKMRRKKIYEIISTVKILSILCCCMVIFSIYDDGKEIGIVSKVYELDLIILGLIGIIILILVYPIWVLLSKETEDRSIVGFKGNLEMGGFFLLLAILTLLSGGHTSNYKFLFLFIIIISTLQYGKKYGVNIALLSSLFILVVDLLSMSSLESNTYFQIDIVLSAVFLLTAWLLGDYVHIEKDYAQKMILYFNEREVAEKELVATLELDKIKNEFFGNISHELKTPVNVIFGTVQLLDVQAKEGNVCNDKYLKIMKQNCYRLIRLVNNLVDTTKLDSGFYDLNLQNVNVVNVVESITLSVAQYVEGKGLTLEFDTDVEEKVLACDSEKIERIMLNLLSNAVKFTDIGGKIIVNMTDKGSHIIISVKDTGIGISPKDLKVIFQRFKQVDKSLTRNSEGSGIGLSLVKSLVEMHGGRVYTESQLGKGSNFIIELPVKMVDTEENNYKGIFERGESSEIERIKVEFSDIYL